MIMIMQKVAVSSVTVSLLVEKIGKEKFVIEQKLLEPFLMENSSCVTIANIFYFSTVLKKWKGEEDGWEETIWEDNQDRVTVAASDQRPATPWFTYRLSSSATTAAGLIHSLSLHGCLHSSPLWRRTHKQRLLATRRTQLTFTGEEQPGGSHGKEVTQRTVLD